MLHPFQPHMEFADAEGTLEYDEDMGMTASDLEDSLPRGYILKTAAEDRADKRMKRFRSANGFEQEF